MVESSFFYTSFDEYCDPKKKQAASCSPRYRLYNSSHTRLCTLVLSSVDLIKSNQISAGMLTPDISLEVTFDSHDERLILRNYLYLTCLKRFDGVKNNLTLAF